MPANSSFFHEYWLDVWQRSILTLDVLREEGSNERGCTVFVDGGANIRA
jgi:hypothetical protein